MKMDIQTLKFKVITTGMGLGITKEASMEAFESQAREMLPSLNTLAQLEKELLEMLPELEERVEAIKLKKVNHLEQIEHLEKQIDELDILADDYIETLTAHEAQLAVLKEQEKKFDELLSKVFKRKENVIAEKLVELYNTIKYEAVPEFKALKETVEDIVNNRNKESIDQVLKKIQNEIWAYGGTFNMTAEEQGLYKHYGDIAKNPRFKDKLGRPRKYYISSSDTY
jgi:DNA repair exonuclease SbcCD ATPase subunit